MDTEIRDVLRNRRLELHLTMKQIADAVGVSEGTVSRWDVFEYPQSGTFHILRHFSFSVKNIMAHIYAQLCPQNAHQIGGGSLPHLDVCPDQFLDVSLFAGNLFQFCDDVRIGVVVEADRHESRVLLLILLVRSVLCF